MARSNPSRSHVLERLAGVELLSLDVDGVLTDAGLYFLDDGSQMRKFNARDGVGIQRVLAAGVQVVVITASKTESIVHRCERLGIKHTFIGADDKIAVLNKHCETLGIDLAAVAHVGDDLNDLPVLQAVGCPLTVADAVDEVLDTVFFATSRRGGDAAVREICDLIVAARNPTA
jgi:3-deoxy-D-manno-octulosonate 8-phosphate phosphatase (KDO 8-P phosphatase)